MKTIHAKLQSFIKPTTLFRDFRLSRTGGSMEYQPLIIEMNEERVTLKYKENSITVGVYDNSDGSMVNINKEMFLAFANELQ